MYVANQLFATLDPTLRRMDLPKCGPIVLADTVGFISHLPHDLIEAFHATLEEVTEAALILHIVDAQDVNKKFHINEVNSVLASINADTVPSILVYNKIDLRPDFSASIKRNEFNQISHVYISAVKGEGLSELAEAMAEVLEKDLIKAEVVLLPHQAKLRAELYAREAVLKERINEAGEFLLTIRLPRADFDKFFPSK